MDFSKAGLIEGLLKVVQVAIFIIASMAVVGLGMFVANQSITWKEVMLAMLVAGANLVFVFLQKWLSTKK